jgi:hypothetical protein
VFGKTEECLDIFHGAEHISACGKEVFGETQGATDWFERMRLVLLSEGFAGVETADGSKFASAAVCNLPSLLVVV